MWVAGYYLWSNWTLAAIFLGALYVTGGGFYAAGENAYIAAVTLGGIVGLLSLIVYLTFFS